MRLFIVLTLFLSSLAFSEAPSMTASDSLKQCSSALNDVLSTIQGLDSTRVQVTQLLESQFMMQKDRLDSLSLSLFGTSLFGFLAFIWLWFANYRIRKVYLNSISTRNTLIDKLTLKINPDTPNGDLATGQFPKSKWILTNRIISITLFVFFAICALFI